MSLDLYCDKLQKVSGDSLGYLSGACGSSAVYQGNYDKALIGPKGWLADPALSTFGWSFILAVKQSVDNFCSI